jgi:hypothetical protein
MTGKTKDRKAAQTGKAPKPKTSSEPSTSSDSKRKHREEMLDEGIEETFPASDPVSVRITK